MNRRAEIRTFLKDTLVAAATTFADKVECRRVDPLEESEFPFLLIYDDTESAERIGHQGMVSRTVPVVIDLKAKVEAATPDDDLDALVGEVEDAIAAASLPAFMRSLQYRSTEKQFSNESETLVGSALITYDATYLTEK